MVFYRGSNLRLDNIIKGEKPYSLSFGRSLFSGMFRDIGASPFHYMRRADNDAYAVVVDPNDPNTKEFFYYKSLDFLDGLYGQGEMFHIRSKICQTFEKSEPGKRIRIAGVRYPLTKEEGSGLLISSWSQEKLEKYWTALEKIKLFSCDDQ